MNFDLSEEQEMFRSSVERFAAPIDVEARRKLRRHEGGYDRARWESLAELGLIALAAGEDAGGMGGTPLDLALVAEAIGKANAPDPWLELGVLPTLLLDRGRAHGALEKVLAGESIATLAWTERAQRYSLAAKATRAERDGQGFRITGEKTMVLGAALADLFVVTADLDGETRAFLVAADAEGLEMRPYRLADGSIAGEIRLTRVSVSEAALLDLDAEALGEIASEIRLHASAEMVGLSQRLLDETLRYVKEREQFGVPIGSFQALQHRLVEAYARLEQSRSILYRAAMGARDAEGSGWQRAIAGAKAYIGENADAIAREAVQMHGGMGITDELAIGHAMKRVMVLARLFGDTDSALAEYAMAA
ncbi:MAG: acyl-CoA dehydrogenase [Erythrobacter sp.]|jgi:alkylation response protein AidB-like acyl-CoA dehydrogenase|nr:acyl-CoA dehydrogenase [Erythrobacter sp.]